MCSLAVVKPDYEDQAADVEERDQGKPQPFTRVRVDLVAPPAHCVAERVKRTGPCPWAGAASLNAATVETIARIAKANTATAARAGAHLLFGLAC